LSLAKRSLEHKRSSSTEAPSSSSCTERDDDDATVTIDNLSEAPAPSPAAPSLRDNNFTQVERLELIRFPGQFRKDYATFDFFSQASNDVGVS
jgi:hypothetical protein